MRWQRHSAEAVRLWPVARASDQVDGFVLGAKKMYNPRHLQPRADMRFGCAGAVNQLTCATGR